MSVQDKRSQEIAKDFVRRMRARGHSRKEVLEMIDLAEDTVCPAPDQPDPPIPHDLMVVMFGPVQRV